MSAAFSTTMKMAELLEKDPSLIGVFSRMGFPFGYGDSSVSEVCAEAGTDPDTFLLICRVYSQEGYRPAREELEKADRSVIVKYLSMSHSHYMNVAMKELAAGLGRMIVPCGDETQRVIWSFFTDFKEELQKHFAFEEECVFPNMDSPDADIPEEDHSAVEETLEDLKSLVMKHLPADADHLNISIHTVISHRKNITRKTGIKTVSGLTVYALLNDLVDIHSIE